MTVVRFALSLLHQQKRVCGLVVIASAFGLKGLRLSHNKYILYIYHRTGTGS